ncbi:MAG: pantetheine-phosphate adenylyltransferase [Bacteriovoracaceae bacterium]
MSKYRTAIYAGTFDPFTNGHENILNRSLKLFDQVVVLIAKSPSKRPLFSVEQRLEMLTECFKEEPRIQVDCWDGLVVDYAKKNKIGTLVRGLRPTGDFESEFQMASMNNDLYPEIETCFLMTEGDYYFISSSLIREVQAHERSIEAYVPSGVYKWIQKNK